MKLSRFTYAMSPLFAAAIFAMPSSVLAVNNTWTGAVDGTWDVGTTENWTSPTTWTTTDTAIFGTAGPKSINVATGGVSTAGFTINTGAIGYVFSGSTLTSTANVNINEDTRFDNQIDFGGVTTTVASGKTLTLAGGGSIRGIRGGATTSNVNFTAGNYTLPASTFFGDTGGAAVLNLNFTGASTFSIGGNNVIGYSNQVTLTYNSSGTSAFTGSVAIGRAGAGTSSVIVQQGTLNSLGITISNGANATLDVQGGAFNAGTNNVLISNNTTYASLAKVSGGTLTAGTVQFNSAVGGSSTFQLTAGTANINNFTQTNGGTKSIALSGGTLGTNTSTSATWTLDMSLAGNTKIRAATAAGASANITISGNLTGSGGFTKTEAGTVTLTGLSTTYSGVTTVEAGTLATGTSGGSLGTGTVTVLGTGILTLGNNQSISDTAMLMFASSSKINLNQSGTEIVGGLYNSSTSTAIASGTYTAADLNTLTGTNVFSGSGILQITPVPEPSSAALIALSGLALLRRRRK